MNPILRAFIALAVTLVVLGAAAHGLGLDGRGYMAGIVLVGALAAFWQYRAGK